MTQFQIRLKMTADTQQRKNNFQVLLTNLSKSQQKKLKI